MQTATKQTITYSVPLIGYPKKYLVLHFRITRQGAGLSLLQLASDLRDLADYTLVKWEVFDPEHFSFSLKEKCKPEVITKDYLVIVLAWTRGS